MIQVDGCCLIGDPSLACVCTTIVVCIEPSDLLHQSFAKLAVKMVNQSSSNIDYGNILHMAKSLYSFVGEVLTGKL